MTRSATASAKPEAPPMAEPTIAPAAPPPAAAPAAPPDSSVERISDAHFDNLPADQQARYSRIRAGPDGGSEWRLRSDLTPDGKSPVAPTAHAPDAPATVVDGKLRIGTGETAFELSPDDIKMLITAKAERDMRASQVPGTAADYKAELPKDLKLPPGVEIKIDGNDPAFKDLQVFAHSRGWSQNDLSAALGIFASHQAREAAALNAALKAEVAKLGPNGTSRITALHQWLRGTVGDDMAKPLASMLVSERHVRALEFLAAKFTSGGAANFSQAHREPAQGSGRVSDEEYQKMSPAQRWSYSRCFDQSKFQR
jgi:hypothetical protein